MPHYCVNTNAQPGSRDHEVHDLASTRNCLPAQHNRRDLGWHANCRDAVAAARRLYTDSNGCAHCVPLCHTT
jgi:hypothetical protein